MSFKITWTKIPLSAHVPALTRSSNSLAIIGDEAFLFGGEQLVVFPELHYAKLMMFQCTANTSRRAPVQS